MRILITGSRDWPDPGAVADAILEAMIHHARRNGGRTGAVTIVHGACPTGADSYADAYARANNLLIERHPANWEAHGKRAGFLRNSEMVSLGADICLAFIKDGSKGASMTARMAEDANIPTRRIVP